MARKISIATGKMVEKKETTDNRYWTVGEFARRGLVGGQETETVTGQAVVHPPEVE
jgi:hypothetical protein